MSQCRWSDPAGDNVNVVVFIAGEEVASREVDTPNDGSAVQVVVPVDPRNVVPEGRQTIEVLLEDENGASAELSAGGRILFDRTAPEITIGNQLRDGICYNPNQIPDPDIDVADADPNPSITREVASRAVVAHWLSQQRIAAATKARRAVSI